MITIVGAYPNKENEKDGMVQRIVAVDTILYAEKREYLDISFRRYVVKKKEEQNNTIVYRLNFFIYFWFILYILYKSDIVYVHSIYNALRVLPVYFFKRKVITDMHGVVIEELGLSGRIFDNIRRVIYIPIEKIVMKKSWKIIVVTNSMGKYFSKKYKRKYGYLVISIFTTKPRLDEPDRNAKGIVYSGGVQPWQCADKLVDIINELGNRFSWTILTENVDYFKGKIHDDITAIKLATVEPSAVSQYYRKNSFGIVLRDDIIVNNVACPTKLIEYLNDGLIPIVKSEKIGDFFEYGYKYVKYEDLMQGRLPKKTEIISMRRHNILVLDEIVANTKNNIKKLLDEIH